MKIYITIIVCIINWGCTQKDEFYYRNSFNKNREAYHLMDEKVLNLFDKQDSLFKFRIGLTGKRFTQDPFINDSIAFRFYGLKLEPEDKNLISNLMNELSLEVVLFYRDSTKYIFGGAHKDTIINYKNRHTQPKESVLIDTNTFLIFEH